MCFALQWTIGKPDTLHQRTVYINNTKLHFDLLHNFGELSNSGTLFWNLKISLLDMVDTNVNQNTDSTKLDKTK